MGEPVKRLAAVLILAQLVTVLPSASGADPVDVERRIDALLGRMTLQE